MIATVPYVTAMSIKPDYSVVYNKYIGDGHCKRGTSKKSLDNLNQNQSKGLISKKAKSKIIDRLSWFHKLSKIKKVKSNKNGKYWQFKLSMITLTLSSKQMHSDTVIKRQLLNNFISSLISGLIINLLDKSGTHAKINYTISIIALPLLILTLLIYTVLEVSVMFLGTWLNIALKIIRNTGK